MANLDLDAKRAARDEARADRDPPTITVGGREYKLTPVMSIDAAELYVEGKGAEFVRRILADPTEADDLLANRLEWADLDEILTVWGLNSGESSASNGSSPKGGKRSRPTSTTPTA